jgi:hypothetical protein
MSCHSGVPVGLVCRHPPVHRINDFAEVRAAQSSQHRGGHHEDPAAVRPVHANAKDRQTLVASMET